MGRDGINTRLEFEVDNDTDIPSLPSDLSFSNGASASSSLSLSSPLPLTLLLLNCPLIAIYFLLLYQASVTFYYTYDIKIVLTI